MFSVCALDFSSRRTFCFIMKIIHALFLVSASAFAQYGDDIKSSSDAASAISLRLDAIKKNDENDQALRDAKAAVDASHQPLDQTAAALNAQSIEASNQQAAVMLLNSLKK